VAVACVAATALGGVGVAYMSSTTAIVQLQPDRAMIGRVIALQTILQVGTTPIGGPVLGFIADSAGPKAPVLVGSIAALAAAALGLVSARRQLTRSRTIPRLEHTEDPVDVESDENSCTDSHADAPSQRAELGALPECGNGHSGTT
jgi:MFS family permease